MKSRLLGAACAFTLTVLANTAHAAVINTISGLDIGGTLYDVTFHNNVGDSFNALWDADNDGVFGGGASLFNAAPTFWDDRDGAIAAATAIAGYLGDTNQTTALGDAFLVPRGGTITNDIWDAVSTYGDPRIALDDDPIAFIGVADHIDNTVDGLPYASFSSASPAAVPVPAAVWLFGSGLVGLIGIARRKKA